MRERIHVWRDIYGSYEHVGLDESANNVINMGFPEIARLADVKRRGMRLRADFAFDEDSRDDCLSPVGDRAGHGACERRPQDTSADRDDKLGSPGAREKVLAL